MGQTYIEVYEEFLALLDKDMAGAGNAGFAIVKLAAEHATLNKRMAEAFLVMAKAKADLAVKNDPGTAKVYSSSKVDQLIEASPEYAAYCLAKTDVENVQVYLRSLGALQFGLKGEQSQS